jgi:hypothetical protein
VTQVFYGLCLLLVIMFLPNGIWPPLKRRLGLEVRRGTGAAAPQPSGDRGRGAEPRPEKDGLQ